MENALQKIYFASDHAGFELKNILLEYVRDELGYSVEDCGAFTHVSDDDYPEFVSLAAKKVSESPANTRAIILGGSGQGEAIVANRFTGVRAVVYYGSVPKIVKLSREHNDANVLSLGARFVTAGESKSVVATWLSCPFSGDARHKRRIAAIDSIT